MQVPKKEKVQFLQKSKHIQLVVKLQAIFLNFALLMQVIPLNLFLAFLYPMFQYGAGRSIKWNAE